MEPVTMYKTESGKLFDTKKEAIRSEAEEPLIKKLNEIADKEDLNEDERIGFVETCKCYTLELIDILITHKNSITPQDDLPF